MDPILRKPRVTVAVLAACLCAPSAFAQWNPPAAQWLKSDATDVRVMSWNIQDKICSTSTTKLEGLNGWCAMARIVASMQPDVLVMLEVGDNSGNGTGSSVDTVANLTTTINLFLHGGNDPFKANAPVTAYVQKYAPSYDLPYVYVSDQDDGFNRNVVLSRYPFADLNGDTKPVISQFSMLPAAYAPGGSSGIRGFIFAEINLPDATYAGNMVMGTGHLKSGGAASDLSDRLNASKNIAYYIDSIFNGLGTSTPDPNNIVFDAPKITTVLDSNTPVIWGGDFNEDENSNGRDGPALWMTRAQSANPGGTDGTDRDRSDSSFDDAREFFTNNRTTQSSSKLDYICWQDSIATPRRTFIFNSGLTPSTAWPPQTIGFTGSPSLVTSQASDHRPVIADFILPLVVTAPGPFSLVSPADGSVHTVLTPTLNWTAATGATTYTVTIAANPALTSPILTQPGLAGTTFIIPGGLLATCNTYYWGVTASNTGGSTASTPTSFGFDTLRPADFNGDGFVTGEDFDAYVAAFEAGDIASDFDGDGFVTGEDFDAYVAAFESGC